MTQATETETTSAKAIVGAGIAIVGSGVTTAVALTTIDSPWFVPLTIVSAMLTTAASYWGIYATTNEEIV